MESNSDFVNINELSLGANSPSDYEKEIYDLQQMLEITKSLCSTLELSALIESILYTVMAQMRVTGAGVLLLGSVTSQSFQLRTNYSNMDVDPSADYSIPKKSLLVEKLETSNKVYTIQELQNELPDCKEVETLKGLQPTLIVPLILKNHLNGILVLGERIFMGKTNESYTDYEKKEILTIASIAAIAINTASLIELSSTDMMTNLKFKYYFFNVLTDRIDAASHSGTPLSVVMFDIDFFKNINDKYGHSCGDYVLAQVATIIRKSVRSLDVAARYGGEEFVVLLNNAIAKDAVRVAERIRTNVEKFNFTYQEQILRVTVSCGVSTFVSEDGSKISAKALVDQADKALYTSKKEGRNRTKFADETILNANKSTEEN